jgi:hypothetical protein
MVGLNGHQFIGFESALGFASVKKKPALPAFLWRKAMGDMTMWMMPFDTALQSQAA